MKIGKNILDNKSSGLTPPKKEASKNLARLSEQRWKKKTRDVEETEVRFKVPEEGQPTTSQLAQQETELIREKNTYGGKQTFQEDEEQQI